MHMSIEMRWLPLVMFLLFFAVAFVGRSLLLWRTTRVNPYVQPSDDSAEGYVARAFRWCLVALLLILAAHALGWPMGSLPWPPGATFWPGTALTGVALLWVAIAQHQMGASWRIGINHTRATALVSRGVFSLSRNPIFLGMRIALLGAVMMAPTATTLAAAIAGELLMQLQVRLEEAHLRHHHGPAYEAYAGQVARWWGSRPAPR